jgi:hypothetical protein
MAKDTHSTLPVDAELVLPEQVTIALAESAGAAREGCSRWRWGLAWGCGGACWPPTSSGWSAQGPPQS